MLIAGIEFPGMERIDDDENYGIIVTKCKCGWVETTDVLDGTVSYMKTMFHASNCPQAKEQA